ncbi:MAG: hypothetical protein PHN84_13020 [Desulfuromonadaceae bacterium]|nr:hypothetical protein [Desulfuromonadaceae bacterium]MDD2854443.1 hypothetical protein [Desulfuromonadaceae bacterium]
MNIKYFSSFVTVCIIFIFNTGTLLASEVSSEVEKSMSDTLDIWREGRFEQLFDQLAHRGRTSRESFVKRMQESSIRPACCWQKMERFKLVQKKLTEATVYVKIGLEGTANSTDSITREFKMSNTEGEWRMQLADVLSIAGVSGNKKSAARRNSKKSSPYPD